jgi:hypothetical protein
MTTFDIDVEDLQNPNYFTQGSIEIFPQVHLHAGTTTLLAGYNGTGKSTLALQIAHELASVGIKSFIISPEMPPRFTAQILARQAANPASPTIGLWREAALLIKENFLISTVEDRLSPDLCIADMDVAYMTGCRFFVLDSITCIRTGHELHQQAEFADQLRGWTRAHPDCYLVAVAHLRKPAGHLGRVSRYDIRGAGEISDLAGHIWLVERKDPFNPNDEKYYGTFDSRITVDKNRATGKLVTKMLNFSMPQRLFHHAPQPPDYLAHFKSSPEHVARMY